MSDEAGPGGAGGGGSQGAGGAEKSREVAPAVQGVMAALKAAGAAFRSYEAHHQAEAANLEAGIRGVSMHGSSVELVRNTEQAKSRGAKAVANRELAEMCERAIADLEAALAPADAGPKPKAKAPPTPSALFRAGFDYGAMAMLYAEIPEDARPARWGEKPAPPPTWEDAWAVVRAQIAAAK